MIQRALIVEDEPLIAIDLEATLRSLGFDVCGRASNPREAVELATSRQPDFILMDVYLDEGRRGINAAKWLREACSFVYYRAQRLGDRGAHPRFAAGGSLVRETSAS